ncbi:MAG: PaaI family thioesterase [Chloroflexi bacterium]|nr:PaaI family thioesterase [Chloroflexota bacterium]
MTEAADERRRSPFSAFIGTEMEELREGYARLSLVLEPRHTNPHGVMHGGVVTTMMDSALGAALGALRGEEARRRPHATIEMNASFLGSARPGDRIAVEGRVLRLGRTVAFGEAEARRGDGALVAVARFAFAVGGRDG